jgi:SEC-C motif domain protein
MSSCPCGSGRELDQCCGPIVAGAPAPTPEALMRSRYTAFATGAIDHIERSHAPEVKDDFNRADAEAWSKAAKWEGLEIRRTEGGAEGDETGEVEFVARFRQGGQPHVHHELASFRRVDGEWRYVDGELNPKPVTRHVVKVGRNDPCPCGSGKKYKKCCGA